MYMFRSRCSGLDIECRNPLVSIRHGSEVVVTGA
jgi:hypothetical protein